MTIYRYSTFFDFSLIVTISLDFREIFFTFLSNYSTGRFSIIKLTILFSFIVYNPSIYSILSLTEVRKVIAGSGIKLGAQNIFWEPNEGSYTGEISAQMISGWCEYVIVGHSERRKYFDETDDVVNKKIKAGLQHGLQVIICVGESHTQNTAGDTKDVIEHQIRSAYEGISHDEALHTVVAYEPIWAIGTGCASTATAANKVSEKYYQSLVLNRLYCR